MKTTKILMVAGLPAFVVVLYLFLQHPHKIPVVVQDTFYMEEDFDTVRRTIVRTECMSKLIELRGCQIISKKWDSAMLNTDRLSFRSNWIVDFSELVRLRVDVPYFNNKILDFRETAHITPDLILINSTMLYPVDELRGYCTVMHISRFGNKTKVDVKILANVEYKAPCIESFCAKIDKNIIEEISAGAYDTREAFKRVIRQYKGKFFNFKIPVKK
jgi:hypothetical protein